MIIDHIAWAAKMDSISKRFEPMLKGCYDFSPPAGWLGIVEKLLEDLSQLDHIPQILQVKSKLGGLRCYLSASSTQADHLVREAESQAATTCEMCGAQARVIECGKRGAYEPTMCDRCFEKWKDRFKQ